MVIIGKKYGRLANRLWVFSYYIANSIEYGYNLIYRNFDEFIRYFNATRKNDFNGYPIKTRISKFLPLDLILYWFMQLIIEIIKNIRPILPFYVIKKVPRVGEGYDMNDPEFIKNANSKMIITRDGGFYFRDNQNLLRHKEMIKRFFEPLPKFRHNISQLIKECKNESDVLVGVHIRKGDFIKWKKGLWYYDNSYYRECIKSLQKQLDHNGNRILFLIVSDEPVNENDFSEIPLKKGTGHMVEDLYALAECDYIIGPPSTYTLWASFYGDTPLWFMEHKGDIPDLSAFFIAEEVGQYTRIIDKY